MSLSDHFLMVNLILHKILLPILISRHPLPFSISLSRHTFARKFTEKNKMNIETLNVCDEMTGNGDNGYTIKT